MIEEKFKTLIKRVFWLIAVVLVLTIPMMIFVEPTMAQHPTFPEATPTNTAYLVLGGLGAFTLIVLGLFFFYILPATIDLVKAILKARQEAKGELFP